MATCNEIWKLLSLEKFQGLSSYGQSKMPQSLPWLWEGLKWGWQAAECSFVESLDNPDQKKSLEGIDLPSGHGSYACPWSQGDTCFYVHSFPEHRAMSSRFGTGHTTCQTMVDDLMGRTLIWSKQPILIPWGTGNNHMGINFCGLISRDPWPSTSWVFEIVSFFWRGIFLYILTALFSPRSQIRCFWEEVDVGRRGKYEESTMRCVCRCHNKTHCFIWS